VQHILDYPKNLNLRIVDVPLWPGTGEVGTTLGKESGNAEITIVI
jgi:hypothetical protein